MTIPARLLALAAGLAVALAGCGETVIDDGKAEDEIRTEIASATGQDGIEIDCPDDVEAKRGDRFECQARGADGSRAQVQVVQQDDEGNVRFSAPLLHTDEAESQIAGDVGRRTNRKVEVDCPDLIALREGTRWACDAKDDQGETAKVNARATDAEGNFTYELGTG